MAFMAIIFYFLFYFRNFEKFLISSGRDLNVVINPLLHISNQVIRRHSHLRDVQTGVTTYFNKAKADGIELIIVIIPENPTGVYGKKLIYLMTT